MSATPWMKWFPADWRADPKLRACEPMSRYVWMEMLGLMHEAEPHGHLVINGKAISPATLSKLIDVPLKAVKAALHDLDEHAVFSVTDAGIIFSRRIVRDDLRATSLRLRGKKGGNPALTKQEVSTSQDKPEVIHEVKPICQKPEAREEVTSPPSLPLSEPKEPTSPFALRAEGEATVVRLDETAGKYPDDFEDLWREYLTVKAPNSSKFKAHRAWRALSLQQRRCCWAGLVEYILWLRDERRKRPDFPAKHLQTFINERGWEAYLERQAEQREAQAWSM